MGDVFFSEKRTFQYSTIFFWIIPSRCTDVKRRACYESQFKFFALACLTAAVSLVTANSISADAALPRNQSPIDYVVAVVNDSAITLSALENEINIRQIRDPSDKVNRARLLKNLIEQKLLLQEAERWGIPLARWREKVNAEIDDIKSVYQSESLFFEELQESGLEYKDLEEWIKSRLILNELIVRRFRSNIDVEVIEQEAIQYFNQNQVLQFQFIMALSRPEDSLDQQTQSKQLAEKIYLRLQAGEKFEAIQHAFRTSVNLKVEYEPQIITADTQLGSTLAKLANNETSHPILTPEGYLICKLIDQESPHWKSDAAAIEDIKNTMVQSAERVQIDAWLKEQREMGDIRILDAELAQLQTNEPNPKP